MPRAGLKNKYSDNLYVSVYSRNIGNSGSVSGPLMHLFSQGQEYQEIAWKCVRKKGSDDSADPPFRRSRRCVIDADMR
jgi:hypothetical protein